MQPSQAKTTWSLYKNYRQFYVEIMREHLPHIEALCPEQKTQSKPFYSVTDITHRNHLFILVYYSSPVHQYAQLFQLIEGNQFTEAFSYDYKNNRCVWYHDHFFYRYAMRFHLNHKPQHQAIKHYFELNPLMVYSRYKKVKNNLQTIIAAVNYGVIYGYLDLKNKIMNYRTIIDFHSLSNKKANYAKPLRNKLLSLQKAA